jgi:Protein of unknown function (DUF732)
MRPRRVRRLLCAMTFGAVLAGATIGTGIAKADDLTFIQALNNHGIIVYDASIAVGWGHAICLALNQATGDVVAANFYRITNGDVPDINTAAVWVVVSVEQLCPYQDHRQGMAV